jgi:RHS repeat-associated protein
VRKFAYDSLGRLTRQKLAEQANTIEGQWSDAFVYDTRSNLVQRTDARGVKTNFNYNLGGGLDPLNRLQSISYDKSQASNPSSIWDAATVTIGYMTAGDKTRVQTVTTAGTSTETNTYDAYSRVSEYNITLTNRSSYPMTMSYLYDTANRLTEVRYPAQYGMAGSPRKTVNPSYDNASRLTQLNVNGQIQMNEIVYNPLSQVTSLKTGAYTGNADIEQYSYDAQTGLLTNQKVIKQNTSQTLLDLSYNYNRGNSKGSLNGKTGQLTNIVNNLDRNKDRVYEFDTLGRLITAKGGVAAGGSGVANWTQNYSFDRYGNRQTVTASGVTANNATVPTDGLASLSYNSQTNRITNSNYEYDLAGNQTRGQAPNGSFQRFEYDSAGRLVVVKADDNTTVLETYTYGASRMRLITETPSQNQRKYYAWGGSAVLCEYTEALSSSVLTFAKSYIYAGSRLLSTQIWNGTVETTEFHHPDRLGTKLVTNNAANTFYEQSTLPFGTSLDAEFIGTPTTNQRFTSYDRSQIASLDYAVNRSYSSGQGRFTTVDPIGMSATSLVTPQSLNLYAYVQNNPIDFVDPTGLLCYIVGKVCTGSIDGEPPECDPVIECDPPTKAGGSGGGGGFDPGRGGGGGGGNETIRQTVNRVLSRLGNKKCLDAINAGGYDISPADALKAIQGNIKFNKDLKAPAATSPGQTDTGWIDLGSSFFDKTVVDGYGNNWNNITGLNTLRLREFIILHELRHLFGAEHYDDAGLREDIRIILKECFGVTFNFKGKIK